MQAVHDLRSRLEALRVLLKDEEHRTQEDLRGKLEKMNFAVTQSTVSRDLRRLGAVKAIDPEGRTIYRLPEENDVPVVIGGTIGTMVHEIQANQSVIVIHTSPGSASLVARHLDRMRPAGILGTIAGDDTIFVATSGKKSVASTILAIQESVGLLG